MLTVSAVRPGATVNEPGGRKGVRLNVLGRVRILCDERSQKFKLTSRPELILLPE
jgi:hypothetical protein